MQTFHVDNRDDTPLFGNSWSRGGSYVRMGHGDSWDDEGRSSWNSWWRDMPPQRKSWLKKGMAAGALVIAVIVIVAAVTGSNASHSINRSGSGAGGNGDPNNGDPSNSRDQNPDKDLGGGGVGIISSPPPPPPNLPPAVPPEAPPAVPSEAPPEAPPTQPDVLPPPPSPPPPSPPPPVDVATQDICNWQGLYLPDTTYPVRYDLSLDVKANTVGAPTVPWSTPDEDNHVNGNVSIAMWLAQPTKCLVLHAHPDMKIASVAWQAPPDATGVVPPPVPATAFTQDLGTQQLRVTFPNELGPVQSGPPVMTAAGVGDQEAALGRLVIAFDYTIGTGLDGFYMSTYTTPDGTFNIASTQFESIAARKAFPCFDEPRFKARFALSIGTLADATVLSNMPLDTNIPAGDSWSTTTFQVSPPMSTYLMAWVIGTLESTGMECVTSPDGGVTNDSKLVTVYASPRMEAYIGAASQMACDALKGLVKTFGVPYPLPKLDLVGIPNFGAGAMENWGLVTYRESALLVDLQDDDDMHELNVANTIAHELVHQWFGNLVTCADWTDLWLNEGFATYFENVGADAVHPEYGLLQYFFFTGITVPALVADSVKAAHPLSTRTPISSLSEPDSYFDTISYEKGAAVLRMLRMYMGVVLKDGAPFTSAAPLTQPLQAGLPQDGLKPLPFSATNVTYLPLRRRRLLDNRRMLLAEPDEHVPDADEGLWEGRQLAEGSTAPLEESSPLGSEESSPAEADRTVDPALLAFPLRPTWQTEPLLAALRAYLLQYQYQAVKSAHLWDSLSLTTGLPINQWMASWTYNTSYPVLTVTSAVSQPDPANPTSNPTSLSLRQSPMTDPSTCGDWYIPVLTSVLATGDANAGQLEAFTMPECTAAQAVDKYSATDAAPAVLLNVGRYGLYRVNYTDDMWAAIIQHAALLSDQDMAGLLSDAYRLSESGQLGIQVFLDLAQRMSERTEADYASWAVLYGKLQRLHLLLSNAAASDPAWATCSNNLAAWVNKTISYGVVAGVDWETPKGQQTLKARVAKPIIMQTAGLAGDRQAIDWAVYVMKQSDTLTTPVAADLREAVYCLYVQYGGGDAYMKIRSMYLNDSKLPHQKEQLLQAMACTTDPLAQEDYLNNLKAGGSIKTQDVGPSLSDMASQGGAAFKAVWGHLFDPSYLGAVLQRWPGKESATYSLGRYLKELAALFVDTTDQDKVYQFAADNAQLLDPSFKQYYDEHTAQNSKWLAETGPVLCDYLQAALTPAAP